MVRRFLFFTLLFSCYQAMGQDTVHEKFNSKHLEVNDTVRFNFAEDGEILETSEMDSVVIFQDDGTYGDLIWLVYYEGDQPHNLKIEDGNGFHVWWDDPSCDVYRVDIDGTGQLEVVIAWYFSATGTSYSAETYVIQIINLDTEMIMFCEAVDVIENDYYGDSDEYLDGVEEGALQCGYTIDISNDTLSINNYICEYAKKPKQRKLKTIEFYNSMYRVGTYVWKDGAYRWIGE